jgi:hypothetical protein
VWMRTKGEVEVIGAGFGVPRATAYRYRDEGIKVLAERAPDLHEALQQVAEQGWSHVVVDGKLIRTDRCAETTTSVKGETINAWYSGKHRAPGGNVQAVIRPDACRSGSPTSHPAPYTTSPWPATPGHRRAELSRLPTRPAHTGRLRLRRRRPGHQDTDQAARRRAGPRPRQPGLQHPPPGHPLPRRTRLRAAHRPLARPATGHHQPPSNR